MPLFECSKCHVVDNTALGNFWWDVMQEHKPALCTECDPEVGKWHGKFPRVLMARYVEEFGAKAVEYPVQSREPSREPASDAQGRQKTA